MNHKVKIVVILLIIILINYFSTLIFARVDFTAGQIYTLSMPTKNVAANLPQELEIKVFMSENLPPQLIVSSRSVQDTLEEYQKYSQGRLKLSFTDPAQDEEGKKLAQGLQIPEIEAQIVEKDQLSFKKIYYGLAILKPKAETPDNLENPLDKYEKFEVLPVIQDLENFEYELTSLLMKLSTTDEKIVAFLSGHGEYELASAQQSAWSQGAEGYPILEFLQKNYLTKTITLQEGAADLGAEAEPTEASAGDQAKGEFGAELNDIDTLVIADPKISLSDQEAQRIIKFVAEGGDVIFLVDRVQVNNNMQAMVGQEDWQNLLSNWGIEIESKLVADASMAMSTFQKQTGNFRSIVSMPYPFFVKVMNLNPDYSATKQLETLMLPWTSPLRIKTMEEVNTTVLASTSDQYVLFEEQEIEIPVPEKTEDPTGGGGTASPEAEMGTEQAEDMIVQPEETMGAAEPQIIKQPIDINPYQQISIPNQRKELLPLAVLAQKPEQGTFVVVADADFLTTNFASQFSSNIVFFLNIVDSLTMGTELIDIRSRGVMDRPIKNISESEKDLMRWGNIIGIPLLFVVYGMFRKAKREKRKREINSKT
jgi:gliding-associated putative ABC transporter substrate-binding component GldG